MPLQPMRFRRYCLARLAGLLNGCSKESLLRIIHHRKAVTLDVLLPSRGTSPATTQEAGKPSPHSARARPASRSSAHRRPPSVPTAGATRAASSPDRPARSSLLTPSTSSPSSVPPPPSGRCARSAHLVHRYPIESRSSHWSVSSHGVNTSALTGANTASKRGFIRSGTAEIRTQVLPTPSAEDTTTLRSRS